jgi:hypothetical protein
MASKTRLHISPAREGGVAMALNSERIAYPADLEGEKSKY